MDWIDTVHAPFLADPDRCSPYEPSNRLYLNPLYIAVDQVSGFASNAALEDILDGLRSTDLVDYVEVSRIKIDCLRSVWTQQQQSLHGTRGLDTIAFDEFVRERGKGLRMHALFEAISFSMAQEGKGAGWQAWPKEYQDCHSNAVAAFERTHPDEMGFHMWLQWLAHMQLSEMANKACAAGLRIGLYLDLAVGEAVDGSATWSAPNLYISKATIGSPPDPFAADGQDWHLAALLPSAIASGKPSQFRLMLDAAMRYAGAVRIDHAAALWRLFLVPLGSRPDGGAYVDYPWSNLLNILIEASAEAKCLVIGEDLGIVPEGLGDDLAKAQILSYRILSYERDEVSFKPAHDYSSLALACISTHDHQTLAGWWRGADIETRAEHGILSTDITKKHIEGRRNERKMLVQALRDAGAEPPKRLASALAKGKKQELVISAHRFIAKTPSLLAAVRLADLTDEKRPTNVPDTSDSYPNWKPKLSIALEGLTRLPLVNEIAKVMRRERGDKSR